MIIDVHGHLVPPDLLAAIRKESGRFPALRLIEDELRRIIRLDDWALMDIRINNFEPFKEIYGFVTGDDVLRFSAMLLNEVVDEFGTPHDFIGHAGGDNFVIISTTENIAILEEKIKERFAEKVLPHYNFMDREQGYITGIDKKGEEKRYPLMTLALGVVSPATHQFADIREITELAAQERRENH